MARLRSGWPGRRFALACVGPPYLAAQNPRGTLRGVVQDASGGRIRAPKSPLQSADWSTERETESSDRGEFRVDNLLPGEYRVRVEATAFAPVESHLEVQASSGARYERDAEPGRRTPGSEGQRGSVIDHHAAGGCIERSAARYRDNAGLARNSTGASKLCKYRVSGAGDRAGRTLGSNQGAHYRSVHRRKFGFE